MPVHIEVRLVGLALRSRAAPTVSWETPRRSRADRPSPARASSGAGRPFRATADRRPGRPVALRRLDGEQLHAAPRPAAARARAARSGPSTCSSRSRVSRICDLVLAIQRKRVVDDRAAARADRKPVEVLLLRQVRGNPDGLAARRPARTPDGQAADLLGGRDVAIEQRRREIADRHVVEAVARFVRRQQRRDVDVERQEIADGVLVLGPRRAAGSWPSGRDWDAPRPRGRATPPGTPPPRRRSASSGRSLPTGGI